MDRLFWRASLHIQIRSDHMNYLRSKNQPIGKYLAELIERDQEEQPEPLIRQILSIVDSISREQDTQREILKTLMREGGK